MQHPSKKGLVTPPPFTDRFVIGNDYEMITIVRFENSEFQSFKILEKNSGHKNYFRFENFKLISRWDSPKELIRYELNVVPSI